MLCDLYVLCVVDEHMYVVAQEQKQCLARIIRPDTNKSCPTTPHQCGPCNLIVTPRHTMGLRGYASVAAESTTTQTATIRRPIGRFAQRRTFPTLQNHLAGATHLCNQTQATKRGMSLQVQRESSHRASSDTSCWTSMP